MPKKLSPFSSQHTTWRFGGGGLPRREFSVEPKRSRRAASIGDGGFPSSPATCTQRGGVGLPGPALLLPTPQPAPSSRSQVEGKREMKSVRGHTTRLEEKLVSEVLLVSLLTTPCPTHHCSFSKAAHCHPPYPVQAGTFPIPSSSGSG